MKTRLKLFFSGILAGALTLIWCGPVAWAGTVGLAKTSVQWNQYPFGNYVWDYFIPSGFHWNPVYGQVPSSLNQIANLFEQLLVHIMYAMLQFMDFAIHPTLIVTPILNELSSVITGGYTTFYVRLLPAAFAVMAVFLLYRFARNHHASVMQIIFMFVVITGLGMAFYSKFGPIMTQVTNFDDVTSSYILNLTSELGQKVSGDPGVTTNINPALSVVWDDYVLLPWETGEFGKSSMNLSKFTVSKDEVGQSYAINSGKKTTIKRGQNWVSLMLSSTGDSTGRTDLAKILYSTDIPRGSFYANATEDPGGRLGLAVFNLGFPLCSLVPFLFLAVMAFILFATTFGFLLVVLELAALLPITIIPDYGWNKLFQLVKRAAGLLIQKTLNALYLGLNLFIINLVTVALSGSAATQELSLLITSAILILALFYRGRFMRELTSRLPEEYHWRWREQLRDYRRDIRQQTTPMRRMKRSIDRKRNSRASGPDNSDQNGGGPTQGGGYRSSMRRNPATATGTTSAKGTSRRGQGTTLETQSRSRSGKIGVSATATGRSKIGAAAAAVSSAASRKSRQMPSVVKARRHFGGKRRLYAVKSGQAFVRANRVQRQNVAKSNPGNRMQDAAQSVSVTRQRKTLKAMAVGRWRGELPERLTAKRQYQAPGRKYSLLKPQHGDVRGTMSKPIPVSTSTAPTESSGARRTAPGHLRPVRAVPAAPKTYRHPERVGTLKVTKPSNVSIRPRPTVRQQTNRPPSFTRSH